MLNYLRSVFLLIFIATSVRVFAQPYTFTLDNYDNLIPKMGVAFNEVHPSFYTGFAPKQENPNRIEFRVARGNQARVTFPLDEQAVLTYLYGLEKRNRIYSELMERKIISPVYVPQYSYFKGIIDSSIYDIGRTTSYFAKKKIGREELYIKSLAIMEKLNPGRVFFLRFNLRKYFLNWSKNVNDFYPDDAGLETIDIKKYLIQNSRNTIVLVNSLLPGRINFFNLTGNVEIFNGLVTTIQTILLSKNETETLKATLEFFLKVTQNKFQFRIIENGKFVSAIQCQNPDRSCMLIYPESTAIYPVGTVIDYTNDNDGNLIPHIRNQGVWSFLKRSYHDVDHIRSESYYGFIPKMDWQAEGNGIHNPAVRKNLKSKNFKYLKEKLQIPNEYNYLWAVSRGGVSHGCVGTGAAYLWELRQILPTTSAAMRKVYYFGNKSTDYDVFDIDGNGRPEVMGVNYYFAYSLMGASDVLRREGSKVIPQSFNQEEFFKILYGMKNQYQMISQNQFVFLKPQQTFFLSGRGNEDSLALTFSRNLTTNVPLYEQVYSPEKLQFYKIKGISSDSISEPVSNKTNKYKLLVRLMGRISGCGSFQEEFTNCGESAFNQEFSSLLERF